MTLHLTVRENHVLLMVEVVYLQGFVYAALLH